MDDLGSIIQVPGNLRTEFLAACKDPRASGLKIHGDDEDEPWVEPSEEQVKFLLMFVAGYYSGAPSRTWKTSDGHRYGWNKEGVFVHEDHHKRYFGIRRSTASIALKSAVPEAVPRFITAQKATADEGDTDRILRKMITNLPSISTEMRMQVVRSTFQKADVNQNGVLSRVEIGTMFRRLVNTMSARDVEEVMHEADKDRNDTINYDEFVQWLDNCASEKVQNGLRRAIGTEADVIKASFRVWDNDGDGLVPRRTLEKVLAKTISGFSQQQVKCLCDLLDSDKDGNIDYDEFVDFLFYKAKGVKKA